MRREWIEITAGAGDYNYVLSPSMRREWIEICGCRVAACVLPESPSMRREWIEIRIFLQGGQGDLRYVSLHAEGVD